MVKKRLKCFVIMPFSESSKAHSEEYWTNHFESFLKPEIEKVPSLIAHRSSDELRADILKSIILDLYDSFVVVADLTDRNANVYWELGIRQSFQFKTVTIAEEGTKLPFDISTKRCLFYRPNDPKGDNEFCQNFNKALIDCIKNPIKSDSIILDTLSGKERITGTYDETLKRKLLKCYYALTNICDLYIQINQPEIEFEKEIDRSEVFISLKTLEKFKDECLEHLSLYYNEDKALVKHFGPTTIKILYNQLDINISLEGSYIGRISMTLGNIYVKEKSEIEPLLEQLQNKINEF